MPNRLPPHVTREIPGNHQIRLTTRRAAQVDIVDEGFCILNPVLSPLIPEYQSVLKGTDFLHLTKIIRRLIISQRIL